MVAWDFQVSAFEDGGAKEAQRPQRLESRLVREYVLVKRTAAVAHD